MELEIEDKGKKRVGRPPKMPVPEEPVKKAPAPPETKWPERKEVPKPEPPQGRIEYPGDEEEAHRKLLPPPIDPKDIPHDYEPHKWQQQQLDRPPVRAIAIKGRQLREAMRGGNVLDWVDIHERFVDLWQEARLVIWRAKHKKTGPRIFDPILKKDVQGYIPDDKAVLEAINVTKGVLDSIIKLRREMGSDKAGIPRWAIERIERALRDYPEAQHSLLKELAAENDQEQKD